MADELTTPVTDTNDTNAEAPAAAKKAPAKRAAKKAPAKRAAKKAAAPATPEVDAAVSAEAPAEVSEPAAEAPEAKKAPAKKAAAKKAPAKKAAAKKTTAKKAASKKAAAPADEPLLELPAEADLEPAAAADGAAAEAAAAPAVPVALFQAPAPAKKTTRRRTKAVAPVVEPVEDETDEDEVAAEVADETSEVTPDAVEESAEADEITDADEAEDSDEDSDDEDDESNTPARRRRRRGGRRRRKPAGSGADADNDGDDADSTESTETAEAGEDDSDAENADGAEGGDGGTSRRRRRRRRSGESNGTGEDDPENTVVKVRDSRPLDQQITAVAGSTRLEAKKQRRREGREAGRRRAPIVSEAEFLARRESVERTMVVRQRDDLTQIGVIEDKVLVEHYVARESQTSLIGNIYLGRVQNVLPSMEAAFIDIGKGRNAVLYAGEVNWAALGHKDGQQRKIESVLSSGQTVLVQVTKDPVGHKGARLTSQISLAGRFLVYVPDGTTSGISRKLPDTERNRLKSVLKEIVPDTAGVIVRTAAEGASEDELTRDVERLKARWEDIESKVNAKPSQPQLLYGEPDLTLKVVRDLFTEDFASLVIQGDEAWETVKNYVDHVAPDLAERLVKHETTVRNEDGSTSHHPDLFSVYRVDEQISKGLDRKVWLPSGGSLVIDRTEAMTVVDVNTGKFTGSGGNLEETVTKNNLEAAEEIVRQLRLRDIGGIIVVDFIDMVLESNRDLVLRRLVECLGRDRTRHQVAEVTSLGLVQMTRKRIGTGLVEAFSENCTHCQGRGIVVHEHPVATSGAPQVEPDEAPARGRRRRGGRGRTGNGEETTESSENENTKGGSVPTPKAIAALPRHDYEDEIVHAEEIAEEIEEIADEVVVDEIVTEAVEELLEELIEQAAEVLADAAEAGEDAVETEAAPAEAPRVITRTRGRRGASTAVISTGEAAVLEAEAAPVAVVESVPAPKVVTRTRRGASRDVVHTTEAD